MRDQVNVSPADVTDEHYHHVLPPHPLTGDKDAFTHGLFLAVRLNSVSPRRQA